MPVKVYDGTNWVTVAGDGQAGAPGTSSSIATWVKTASGGETSVSGAGDTGYGTLAYTAGQELVYLNGVLLDRGDDYTATNGTSITGLTALTANDVVTVWTVNSFSVANTYTVAQADSTFAPISVTGGMTLLSTTTLTGASTTVSTISGAYQDLRVLVTGMTNATANGSFRVAINGSTSLSSSTGAFYANAAGGAFTLYNDYTSRYAGNNSGLLRTDANNSYMLTIFDYASTTAPKTYQNILTGLDGNSSNYIQQGQGGYNSNSAVTSLVFSNAGGNWSTGTVRVYGVK